MLDSSGSGAAGVGDGVGYVYESEINTIWSQAGISFNFSYTTWDNSAAQQLSLAERRDLYGDTWVSGASSLAVTAPGLTGAGPQNGSAPPAVPSRSLQLFFVNDHFGTGYNDVEVNGLDPDSNNGTGWVTNPLSSPANQARVAGNALLGIDGVFSTTYRGVMSTEGFERGDLSGVIAHEIGHLIGLRHIGDTATDRAQGNDPTVTIASDVPNLMWEGDAGPMYSGMTYSASELIANFDLTQAQIDAAVFNANVLTAVPEPSAFFYLLASALLSISIRRGKAQQLLFNN